MDFEKRAVYEYTQLRDEDAVRLIDLTRAYFNHEAVAYDSFDSEVERRRLYLAAVDEYAAEVIGREECCDRIVSFGCGTGRRELAISSMANVQADIFGIENASRMAELARTRGLQIFPDMGKLLEQTGRASIDIGLCLYSFIHLPTTAARLEVLKGFHHVLREDGELVSGSRRAVASSGARPEVQGPRAVALFHQPQVTHYA